MSAASVVHLASTFSSLALAFPPSHSQPAHGQHAPPGAASAPSLALSRSQPAAAAAVASSPINPLNGYQSPNTRQMLTLAVTSASACALSTSARVVATSHSAAQPSDAHSATARSSRRRHRTDEELHSPVASHASHTGSDHSSTDTRSGIEAIEHITADFAQLSTVDSQQPAKRAHTDARGTDLTHSLPSSHQPPTSPSASTSPFIHPHKPKPAKRRPAARAATQPPHRGLTSPQPQQLPCKVGASAARLAVHDLLYDGGSGESEAEWEAEHGSELRFLLDSMHVADKDVQAGSMPYIL